MIEQFEPNRPATDDAQSDKRRILGRREAVYESARTDALTGLPNRRAFEAHIQKELANIEKKQREGDAPVRTAWVVLMDIDRFKSVNDTKGHPAGDAVLQRTGAFLKAHVRGTDMVARWGGEEFIILFMDGDKIEVSKRAEQLRAGIKELSIPWEGGAIPVTMSFGVAQLDGVEDIKSGIERADKALYSAKKGSEGGGVGEGRNQVVFSEEKKAA